MLAALSAGGHLRVGMEDTLTYAPGEPVRDNAQLVARAAGLARIAQRPPMSTDDARSFLGIKPMETACMSPKPAPAGGAAVDALLEPAFLENATTQPMSEVRRLRREAEQQEVNLSYTRRLLQGRLDIVRRELQRRSEHDGRSLVDLLPEILSEKGRGPAHGLGRHQTVQPHAPEEYESWVNSLTGGIDLSVDRRADRREAGEGRPGAGRGGARPVRAPPRRAAGDGRSGRRAGPPLPRRRGRRGRAAGRRGPALSTADRPRRPGRTTRSWSRSGAPASSSRRTAARWSSSTPTGR